MLPVGKFGRLVPAAIAHLAVSLLRTRTVEFADSQLQQHYERVLPLTTYLPEELRPVCALMDAYGRFRVTDGEQSPTVREALQILTAPDLRPALRRWYRDYTGEMNPTATKFRQTLSQIVGESL